MFKGGVTEQQIKYYQEQIDTAEDLVQKADEYKRKREQ
jgi:hypothetical protein